MITGKPYQEHEDDFIRSHWQNLSDREMGRNLGRSEVAITSRRAGLGLLRVSRRPKDPSMRPWSLEEDDQVRQMFAADLSDEDIAIALGRTIGAVAQRRSSLRLRRADPPAQFRAGLWSDEDDTVLAWMFRRDWSDERIGEAMGKTARAIKDRRQTLGLARVPRG